MADYSKPTREPVPVDHARAPMVRKGWTKVNGKWMPDGGYSKIGADVAVSPDDTDCSLDASHERMRRILALQTRRIEITAEAGPLTELEIGTLSTLSNTWRTLTQNQPAPDLSELTDEQIEAKLKAVKARGK